MDRFDSWRAAIDLIIALAIIGAVTLCGTLILGLWFALDAMLKMAA